MTQEVSVEMNRNEDGTVKAVKTTVTTENGKESRSYETFNGTEAEVKAKIEASEKVSISLITFLDNAEDDC